MNIVIFGANGPTEQLLTKHALASGHAVTAVTRAAGLPEEVEVVVSNLAYPETLPTALDGVERVFLMDAIDAMPRCMRIIPHSGWVMLLTCLPSSTTSSWDYWHAKARPISLMLDASLPIDLRRLCIHSPGTSQFRKCNRPALLK